MAAALRGSGRRTYTTSSLSRYSSGAAHVLSFTSKEKEGHWNLEVWKLDKIQKKSIVVQHTSTSQSPSRGPGLQLELKRVDLHGAERRRRVGREVVLELPPRVGLAGCVPRVCSDSPAEQLALAVGVGQAPLGRERDREHLAVKERREVDLREARVLPDGELVRKAQQQPPRPQLLQREELHVLGQRCEQRGEVGQRRRLAQRLRAVGALPRGAGERHQRAGVGAVGQRPPHTVGGLARLERQPVRAARDEAGAVAGPVEVYDLRLVELLRQAAVVVVDEAAVHHELDLAVVERGGAHLRIGHWALGIGH
eukprot:scaffold2592_cov72-Phaeocystis_antarctica.AAC.2